MNNSSEPLETNDEVEEYIKSKYFPPIYEAEEGI